MGASAVLKLQKAGFTVDQVEALADFMDTQAASKADLLKETSAIRSDMAEVEHRLETRIIEAKADILKTIIGVMVVNSAVVLAAMFGLAKLLGH